MQEKREPMPVLSSEQKSYYQEQGYLLVSGLIDPAVSSEATAALWRALGATPDDPATWADIRRDSVHRDPAILACFTSQVQEAAAELAEEDVTTFRPPSGTLALNIFPQDGPWSPHPPHIDHALAHDGHKVFPRPLRVAT